MSRRFRLLAPLTLALPVALLPHPAQAACNGAAGCSCTVTATAVSFGSYNPLSGTANDATGTVRVVCTLLLSLGGSFTVDLSTGSSASYAQRTLQQGASHLNYNLYTDAAHSQIWGNATGGSSRVTHNFAALLLVDQSFTVYGRVPAGQNVPAGAYGDTITVTVTY